MRLLSDPKNWNRIVFTISRFSGRISRKYQLTKYFKNIDQDEIELVLKLIEKKRNYFMFLRMKTCLRIFLSIIGLVILTISILCFLYFNSLIGGIITICICALETVLLNYCCWPSVCRWTHLRLPSARDWRCPKPPSKTPASSVRGSVAFRR